MRRGVRLAAGLAAVLASMVTLFVAPQADFVPLTFLATSCMIAAALAVGGYSKLFRPSARSLALGLASAVVLYALFYAGSLGVSAFHPFGISPSAETSIYSLIVSPSNPRYLQVAVLLFDALGYESFFRGVLQKEATRRLGAAAPFAVAAGDALVHVLSFNLLWVVTTFIADSVWGVVYLRTKDLTSSFASHFLWDVVIFILFPIR